MCDKIPYSTKAKAEGAIKSIIRTGHGKNYKVYFCEDHGAWHITSRKKKGKAYKKLKYKMVYPPPFLNEHLKKKKSK